MNQDTICAIATAQGGAIGSIRVSGPEAISITSRIFQPAKAGKLLSEQKPYTLTFGRIYNGEEIIDEVLVSLFRAPHSYTGEDSTEITCHGSSYILQQVMQLLIKNGCRMAQPGEYTQRAFLNGKMDLSQAEAVADLIASSSAATHRLAMSQMRGGFSKELTDLRNKLLNFTSMIELELDFSEEDVEFADRSALRKLADEIEQVISRLVHSFNVGNAIKNGVPVAIIGETNAGKSTLLNVLGCLDTPTAGEYWLDGYSVRQMGKNERAELRNHKIGFVFQSYNLLPKTTSIKNVELPLMYNPAVSAKERERRAIEALDSVGLHDRLYHKSNQMSGGQQQRVAIARALVNDPVLILADEATGNLDTRTSFEILTLFQELYARGRTIVFVTHNPELSAYSSRTIVLKDGRVIQDTRNEKIASAKETLAALPKNED